MMDKQYYESKRKLAHAISNAEWRRRKTKGTVVICRPLDRCVWRRDNGVGYTCGAGGCIMEDDHARVSAKKE